MVEQAAREKTEKIINAELQKAAANPDLQVREMNAHFLQVKETPKKKLSNYLTEPLLSSSRVTSRPSSSQASAEPRRLASL